MKDKEIRIYKCGMIKKAMVIFLSHMEYQKTIITIWIYSSGINVVNKK